jgi:hypothetical protein
MFGDMFTFWQVQFFQEVRVEEFWFFVDEFLDPFLAAFFANGLSTSNHKLPFSREVYNICAHARLLVSKACVFAQN